MKKLFIILSISFIFLGCSSNWYKHDTIYKNHDHMFYSIHGYTKPTPEDIQHCREQKWWGDEYDEDGQLIRKW